MAVPNAFAYRLHDNHAIGGAKASIDLVGIPTIPTKLIQFFDTHGHDCDPPAHIEQQTRESIEAACHVIQHRHVLGMERRGGRRDKHAERIRRTVKGQR